MSRKLAISAALLATSSLLAFSPAAHAYTSAWLQQTTELHAGPDYDYPTIEVVPAGDGVLVHGCLSDWSWCDVGYTGTRGWIAGDQLLGEWESRREPIGSIGPRLGIGFLNFNFSNYWESNYRDRDFYRERDRWRDFSRTHYRDHRDDDRRDGDRNRGRNDRQNDGHQNNDRQQVQQQQQQRDQAQRQQRAQQDQARQNDARQDQAGRAQAQQNQARQSSENARMERVRETNTQRQAQQQQQAQRRQERAQHDAQGAEQHGKPPPGGKKPDDN